MSTNSKSGPNGITGTSRNEQLNGGSGADNINGMGGNDRINAGSGNDIMDGGSGNDLVNGDAGDDLGIYVLSENIGSTDVYDGGSGVDTLQLVLTRAQWQSPAVQADIARFLTFLAQVTNPVNGQATNANFTFSFGLTVSRFEALKVIVDGIEVDPSNQADDNAAPTVNDITLSIPEDGLAITRVFMGDDVDSDDDRASLTYTITSALAGGDGYVANNGDGTFSFAPGGHFQNLGQGETREVTFTYTATDSHGVVSSPATVTLTVVGANDLPVATVDAATTAMESVVTINVLDNDRDVDGDALAVTHVDGVAIAVNDTVSVATGTVRLNADMSLTYQPATGFAGQASFTYSISDGNGGRSTSTVGVNVEQIVDRAPILSAKDPGPVVSPPDVLPGASDDLGVDARAVSDRSINLGGDPSLTVMDDGGVLGDPDGPFDFGLGDADADAFVVTGEFVDTPQVLPGQAGEDRFDNGALSDQLTGRIGDLPLTVMDDGTIFGGSYGFGSILNFEVQAPEDDSFLLTGDLVDQPLVLPVEMTGEAHGFAPMSDLSRALAGDSPLTALEDGQILGGEPWIDASGLYDWA